MKILALAAAAAALLATPALADDGDDWAFKLVNSSAVSAISLTTQRKDGTWSANWLKTPIKPAETRPLRFTPVAGDDRCEVGTRIQFSDGSSFDTKVNYCGIEQVIATDDTLYSK